MDLMETVRKAMAGRSAKVEKAIDAALGGVGRAGDSLRKQAETAKARARQLDSTRTTGEAPTTTAPPAVREVAGGEAPAGEAPPGGAPAGGTGAGPSLKGDLAPRRPPGDPAAPTG